MPVELSSTSSLPLVTRISATFRPAGTVVEIMDVGEGTVTVFVGNAVGTFVDVGVDVNVGRFVAVGGRVAVHVAVEVSVDVAVNVGAAEGVKLG